MHHGVITELDYKRLLRLLHGCIRRRPEEQHQLSNIHQELKQANVVRSEEIPRDIVTMRSVVSLVNPDTGQKMFIELAYPAEANPSAGKISVLTPLGTALIGNRIGSHIEYHDPDGQHLWLIESMQFQPESVGNFDL